MSAVSFGVSPPGVTLNRRERAQDRGPWGASHVSHPQMELSRSGRMCAPTSRPIVRVRGETPVTPLGEWRVRTAIDKNGVTWGVRHRHSHVGDSGWFAW